MKPFSLKILLIVTLLVINIFWAGSNTAVKIGLNSISPISLIFWRFTLASGLLAPLAFFAIKKLKWTNFRGSDLVWMVLAGVILAISNILWVTGIGMSHASDASMLYTFEPILGIIFSYLILKEHLSAWAVVGLMFAIAGAVVISSPDISMIDLKLGDKATGNILIVISLVCEALYSILLKPLSERIPAVILAASSTVIAVVMVAIPFAFSGSVSIPTDPNALAALAYLVGICTIAGLILWVVSMKRLPVSVMFFTLFIQPISGPVIATIVLHEVIKMSDVMGGALMLVGMFIAVVGYLRKRAHSKMFPNL